MAMLTRRPACQTRSKTEKTRPRFSSGIWCWMREEKLTWPVEVPRPLGNQSPEGAGQVAHRGEGEGDQAAQPEGTDDQAGVAVPGGQP